MNAEFIFILCMLSLFAIDYFRGVYKGRNYFTLQNAGVNILGMVGLAFSRPLMALLVGGSLSFFFPSAKKILEEVSPFLVFFVYLLVDDYIHYWLHRISHTQMWLWQLHKVHHEPDTMDVTVSDRNPFIWWCMVPTAWLGAIVVWGGMPEVVIVASMTKGIVSLLAHVNFRWDLVLFKNRFTRPFIWLMSRVISVPDTHHYHHSVEGGEKNYAVLFMFWDMMHRTAEFPEKKMNKFGLYNPAEADPWYVQVFQPFVFRIKKTPAEQVSG